MAIATIVLAGAVVALAQQPPASTPVQLKSVKSLTCSFPASAKAVWQNGEPQVRVGQAPDKLTLTISDVNLDEETATIAGPGGRSTVNAKLSGSNLYFLDLRPNGAAFLTTVFAQESKDKRLKAAHAQTAPDVVQYFGDCEWKQVVDSRQ